MAKTKPKEEPQTAPAPSSAPAAAAPSPAPREYHEKQEKSEKHEKREKQEKHEKQQPEKQEKHEKRGMGVWGPILAGVLLIAFGFIIFLANYYSVPDYLWWPIFLVIVGVAVIIYAIFATSMMRRSPTPPPA